MSETVNFDIVQGDSFSIDVTYEDSEGPVDLTGYSVVFVVRNEPGGRILCANLAVGSGIEFTDAQSGKFTVTVSSQTSKGFTYPKAYYQCQVFTGSTNRNTIFSGWFSVEKGNII